MTPKSCAFLFLLFLSFKAHAWDGNIVYYITGGPIKAQQDSIKEAAVALRDHVLAVHPDAYFGYQHNSESKNICETIVNLKKQVGAPQGKTVIVGHSYGASATTIIARCLQKENIAIELAVAMDMIKRPLDKDPDTIPENVLSLMGFYQTKDRFLRGLQNIHREDGSHDKVTNTEVTGSLGLSPHFGLVTKIMLDSSLVQDAALEALE